MILEQYWQQCFREGTITQSISAVDHHVSPPSPAANAREDRTDMRSTMFTSTVSQSSMSYSMSMHHSIYFVSWHGLNVIKAYHF